jgi:hypothetical protein
MTNKDDAPKSSKAREITHPGMMGDGTEEHLGEMGIPKSRIKKDEVEAAFEKTNPKSSLELPFISHGDMSCITRRKLICLRRHFRLSDIKTL